MTLLRWLGISTAAPLDERARCAVAARPVAAAAVADAIFLLNRMWGVREANEQGAKRPRRPGVEYPAVQHGLPMNDRPDRRRWRH